MSDKSAEGGKKGRGRPKANKSDSDSDSEKSSTKRKAPAKEAPASKRSKASEKASGSSNDTDTTTKTKMNPTKSEFNGVNYEDLQKTSDGKTFNFKIVSWNASGLRALVKVINCTVLSLIRYFSVS